MGWGTGVRERGGKEGMRGIERHGEGDRWRREGER